MLAQTIGLLCASFLCLVWVAESHVRFVCPRPTSVQSDISFSNQSMGYCGVDMKGQFDQEYMEVMPGLLTIRFEETEFHRNSPYRVSLHSADSEAYCVLLDHIPHNNHALFSSKCAEKGNDYPLGVCESSTYYITINIPNVMCHRCYLRLTHILLDSSDKIPCDLNNGTCLGYVSCANIRIRARGEGQGRNLSSCSRYEDNLAGNWPFRPQDQYKVGVAVGEEVEVDPLLVYDAMHRALHMDIPRHACPTEIEEVQVAANGSVVWNMTVQEEDRLADTVVVVWPGVDSEYLQLLQDGQLMLRFRCEDDLFEGNISLQAQNYAEGKYVQGEKEEYSLDGWLAGYRFRGRQAEDLTVVTPAGPCSPTPRNFISFLHLRESREFVHGILVASIVGGYADITMAFYNIKDDITSIVIRGSELLGAPDLKIPLPKERSSILQVSVDISRQIPYIGTVQFLKTVEVKTDNPQIGLSGNFEEGMYTILRDGRDIQGIGAFQFTKGQWLKYEVLVTGLQSNIQSMELQGDPGVVYNLSRSLLHLDQGFCLVEGLVQDLSSKLVLQLWQGRLQLVAYTNTSTMIGMVTVPGSVYCKEASSTACYFVEMTPDGKPTTSGLEKTVPPSGQAVFLLQGSKLLQYSIEVHGAKEHRRELDVSVRDGDDLVFSIKLKPDQHRPATYIADSRLQVSADLLEKLSAGGMKLEVLPTPGQPLTGLTGNLPPIKDHLCMEPKTYIIGEHRGFWSVEAAPFQPMFVMVGDTLQFKYNSNVSLYVFSSKEDLKSCNFSNARQVGKGGNDTDPYTMYTHTDTETVYTVHLTRIESLYFASQQHCNATPPLQLVVNVVPTVHFSVGDSMDSCGLLVFSDWRRKQLQAYSGPEPTGPAIAGVVLGTMVALGFFLWDRRLQEKADIAVPGSRFQRF
ncbi:uncharacterized protein LOC143295681 [Babylonia areolata]|uniref:uncharacterized protein LOC143295681 n=1 Tax=Babylonia areolata TaxID=304850 RepID=UPI003FD52899